MSAVLLGALAALSASALAPVWALPALRRAQVVDVANDRSSHSGVAVRGLGVAPLVAMVVGALVAMTAALEPEATWTLAACVAGAVAVGLVGLVEDIRGLPIAVRAALQWLLGGAAVSAILATTGMPTALVLLLGAAGGVAIAAYVNIANFMDGVDGISVGHGAVVGLAFSALGLIAQSMPLAVGGVVLAAGLAGFAPWNLGPQKRFLGDVGSYLLGAMVALLAVVGIVAGLPLISVGSPLVVYVADTAVTLLRRVVRGDRWYESHREHVYQRLTSALPHPGVAATVAVLSAVSALAGLLVAAGAWPWWGALLVVIAVVLAYFAIPGTLRLEDMRWLLATPAAPAAYPLAAPRLGPIAVIGASGFVGRAVAEQLRSQGAEVLERTAPRVSTAARLPDDVLREAQQHTAELDALTAELSGVAAVVLAAGLAAPDDPISDELYGANALLPVLIVIAADRGGVGRVVHLSSAAVQGRAVVLDESWRVAPFSPYSHSKGLGEAALAALMHSFGDGGTHVDVAIVRATSVQGAGRKTTRSLARLARSRLSSVAAPGDQPTVVSTVRGLAAFVGAVVDSASPMQGVRLQPWENHTVSSTLSTLGGRKPIVLPSWLCSAVVSVALSLGQFVPRFAGFARRLELLWFGQRQQTPSATTPHVPTSRNWLREIQP